MPRFVVFDGTDDNATVPDAAGFSALSGFSALGLIRLNDWTPVATNTVFAHNNTAGNQRSWVFSVLTTGILRLSLAVLGTTSVSHDSTVAPTVNDGDYLWVLATRDSVAGTVKFYTAPFAGSVAPPAIGGFTQLGTDVASVTLGALFNSTAALSFGATNAGGSQFMAGRSYRAQLYSGIYGSGSETLLVDFDPADAANLAATSWSEGTYTWTLNNGAFLDNGGIVVPTPRTNLRNPALRR